MALPRLRSAVEGAADHILLLFAREPDEIDGIARHPNGELRIFVRILHRVLSVSLSRTFRFMWKPPWAKYMSMAFDRGIDQLFLGQMRLLRGDRNGVADAVQRILVRQLGDRKT